MIEETLTLVFGQQEARQRLCRTKLRHNRRHILNRMRLTQLQ